MGSDLSGRSVDSSSLDFSARSSLLKELSLKEDELAPVNVTPIAQ